MHYPEWPNLWSSKRKGHFIKHLLSPNLSTVLWLGSSMVVKLITRNIRLHEWALKLIYNDHISSCKACACYFLSNFYFSPKDSPSKTTKKFFISSKKLFFSQDIQIFVFLPSHLFFHVSHCFRSWSKKILKVYDVINCLNKKLITHFVWYLDKEIRRDIETLSIERVVNKEHFDGKIMQKMCTKN